MQKIHVLISCLCLSLSALVGSCSQHEPVVPAGKNDFLPTDDSVYLQAQEAIYSDPLFARKLLKEAMETRPVQDSTEWYILYSLYIKTYLTTSEFDSVIPFCKRVERYCARQKQLTPRHYYLLTDVNNNIGNRYAIISQNDSALKYFQKTLAYSKRTGNKQVELTGYTNLADVYIRSGHFDKGAYYYRQALFLTDSCGLPKQELINTYMGLGQTYMELRDFERSHHYFDLAYQLYDLMDLNRKFVYFTNHGNVYYFEKKYDEALKLFKQGYELVKSSPEYAYAQSICLTNMGEIYLLTDRLDSSEYCLDQSYTYFKTTGNASALYHASTLLAELALRKGSLSEAAHRFQEGANNPYTEPSLVSIRKRYLQHYFEEAGDYQKAYQYLKENVQMDDSIRNGRIRMRVAETELRYKQDTTLMKQQLFIQEQQSNMKSLELSVYIWILLSVLLFLSALFIYFYQKKKRALLLAETRNKIISLRMENIRNRVSPHFIFNTLNRVISHYAESDNRYQELYNLIKIMRLNLRLTEKLCITLKEEIDFVQTYLLIEQNRFGSSLHVHIQIDPQIAPDKVWLPAMLIQIPVENAIKHGLRQKEGEKQLTISIRKTPAAIEIRIEDNGKGFHVQDETVDRQSTGTGLKVLNQTILLLNAQNTVPITFQIQKSELGTDEYPGCQVKFTIPDHYSFTLPEGK